MASDLKYIPFYWREWLDDDAVLRMTDRQQMWDIRLLFKQTANGAIDNDDIVWWNAARPQEVDPTHIEWKRFKRMVPSIFKEGKDGKLRHPKMTEVRNRSLMLIDAKKKAGKLGADARWGQRVG